MASGHVLAVSLLLIVVVSWARNIPNEPFDMQRIMAEHPDYFAKKSTILSILEKLNVTSAEKRTGGGLGIPNIPQKYGTLLVLL
jgi:hypothetical protein